MKKFNVISYENGIVRHTISARNLNEAIEICEKRGIDCQDDHYIETEKETNKFNAKNVNRRTVYIEDDRF